MVGLFLELEKWRWGWVIHRDILVPGNYQMMVLSKEMRWCMHVFNAPLYTLTTVALGRVWTLAPLLFVMGSQPVFWVVLVHPVFKIGLGCPYLNIKDFIQNPDFWILLKKNTCQSLRAIVKWVLSSCGSPHPAQLPVNAGTELCFLFITLYEAWFLHWHYLPGPCRHFTLQSLLARWSVCRPVRYPRDA